MGTYTQWSNSKKVGNFNWVCGTEQVLKDEVLSLIRTSVHPSVLDHVVLDASHDDEKSIWNLIHCYSLMENSNRLIEIHNADSLKDLSSLEEWISSYQKLRPDTFIVCVALAEAPSAKIRAPKAVTVKCVMPKIEDKLKWTQSYGGLSETTAKRLLEYKNGSLADVANLCRKVSRLLPGMSGVELDIASIKSLEEETPSDFVDALLSKDKPRAHVAASVSGRDSVSKILSYLEYSVTCIETLSAVLGTLHRGDKVPNIPGFPMGRLSELTAMTREYSAKDLVSCRQLLVFLESYYRQGVHEGLLEALVALW